MQRRDQERLLLTMARVLVFNYRKAYCFTVVFNVDVPDLPLPSIATYHHLSTNWRRSTCCSFASLGKEVLFFALAVVPERTAFEGKPMDFPPKLALDHAKLVPAKVASGPPGRGFFSQQIQWVHTVDERNLCTT